MSGQLSVPRLTLRITNMAGLPEGFPVAHRTEGHGFQIGRNPAMAWVLPDPDKRISGEHLRVHYQEGAYWLQDVSKNGTTVNGRPLEGIRRLTHDDLIVIGHINLLKRAKALGDKLIVALSTDEFNLIEKNKTCSNTYADRKVILESLRFVDLVIAEENWEQKNTDVDLYDVDVFVIGDDWEGHFDFLKDKCEVIYLPRTANISTTEIKNHIINIPRG